MEEKEKKVLEYLVLKSRLEVLAKQRDILSSQLMEVMRTIDSINNLGEKENYLPLGSRVFVKSDVEKNKFLVVVGANVALEKNKEDALAFLLLRRAELESALANVSKEMMQIVQRMEVLATEIQKLVGK